jgi:cytochrome c553
VRISVLFAAVMLPVAAYAAEAANGWAFPDRDISPQPPADAAPAAAANAAARLPPDPAAPVIVREGKGPNVRACDQCHWPWGEPQMANAAGLPAAYFMQTMADFKNGARKGPRAATMITLAKELTNEENNVLAEYYASLKPRPWVKVVEAATAPKTYVGPNNARRPWPAGGEEAVGARVIEFPPDFANLRTASSTGYVAYVPSGSIARGETLVKTGGGKTTACIACHGPTLTGAGVVPAIAGRSPTYLGRQLFMYQNGDRDGPNAALMKTVAANLANDDIVAITAYLASLPPS